MAFRLTCFVLLLVAAACATPPSFDSAPAVVGPKLAFVDEGYEDPSFVDYRRRLLDAVRARDTETVLDLADPKIRTSFGDTGGRDDLERKLQNPELWQKLETILTHGGTFRGSGANRAFWAPYVYSAFPETHDAFFTLAVIADDVPLRERPSDDAPVVARLSRDLVSADPAEPARWIEVKTADGRSGWVESKYVWRPIDYRAGFMKSDGRWRMTALVAGD